MTHSPFAAFARNGAAPIQRSAARSGQDGFSAAELGLGLAPGLTIIGTGGSDQLRGGALDDVLDALGGADTLTGGAGNDVLLGGSGNDWLEGNAGSDLLDGGDGNDILSANRNDDLTPAAPASDTLIGGQGDDQLDSSGGAFLYGGAGNDRLGSSGDGNLLDGGEGNDFITAASGSDTIAGGSGDDEILVNNSESVTPVAVVIDAGAGDDVLTLNISAASKSIEITGGSGRDHYFFWPGIHAENTVITDFQTGIGGDQMELYSVPQYGANPFGPSGYLRLVQSGGDTLFQVDEDGAAGTASQFHTLATLRGVLASDVHAANFRGGSNPNGLEVGRYNVGNNAGNSLLGNRLDDTLSGGGGDDALYGGSGNDVLHGDQGSDYLDGENGNDTIDGGAGDDRIVSGDGDDHLSGGSGNDMIGGGWGNDQLDGGDGDDILSDDAGTNTLMGGNGNDTLFTNSGGDDVLDGAAGDDTLEAGAGNVQMNGGNGNDTLKIRANGDSGLFGGGGNDVLDIYSGSGRVVAVAGAGDDTIILHRAMLATSAVSASGGAGVDTYRFLGNERSGSLTVKDFAAGAGGDRIDTKALLKAPSQAADLLLSGILRFEQSGTSTLVQFDSDGSAGAGSAYTLMTLQNVAASTLTVDNVIHTPAAPGVALAPVQLVGVAADGVFAG